MSILRARSLRWTCSILIRHVCFWLRTMLYIKIVAALRRKYTLTTRTVIAISLLCYLAVCLNLNAQAGGDVADQIKQLQQDSRDAQMKNDASWAQQHLADGFVAGNSWGDWETKESFIKDLQNKTSKWKTGNISDPKVATFVRNAAEGLHFQIADVASFP